MGAQDQIAFKRQLFFSFSHCSCSSLAPLFAFFLVYCVSHSLRFFFPSSSPQGLDKYSFYFFLVSDEDSLHLSPAPFIFSCFCVFIYHVAYISPASSLSLSVSCYLFVFPFSFCHHKLPALSVSPSQHGTLSIHMSLSSGSVSHSCALFSFLLLLICPCIPPSLLHEQQGVYRPPGCVWCHGEACLVAAGVFHRRWPLVCAHTHKLRHTYLTCDGG